MALTISATFASRYAWNPAWRRVAWLVWAIWLAFLAYPVADLAHRHLGAVATAAAGLGLAVFAALYLRLWWLVSDAAAGGRRYLPSLIALAALGAGLGLGLRGGWIALFIYMSVACGMTLPFRWVPVTLALTVAESVAAQLASADHGGTLPITMQICLNLFLGLLMVAYRRTLMLIAELQEAREDLARLAVTEERLRFSRDLHDLLGHTLSAISLQSQVARRLIDTDQSEASRQLSQIETVAQQALAEVREAVTGYRQRSLTEELDSARSLLTGAGVRTTVRTAGSPLPAEHDALLAWIVREATTNILKHANANSCQVRVCRRADSVTLDITDDGRGPAHFPVLPGNGLAGMTERVAAAGGRLVAGPAEAGGFALHVWLPPDSTQPARLVPPQPDPR